MKRELIEQFQGKENVTKITSDNGVVSYLTQSRSFDDEVIATGASKLNTVEDEKKHVLFLFNDDGAEVGRYYIGKALQGKSPTELAEIKHSLVVFESWNPAQAKWVPCVGMSDNTKDNSLRDISSNNIENKLEIENNNKEDDFEIINQLGLEPLYAKNEVRKKKIAIEFCKVLLSKIDNWEEYYNNAKRCINRSFFYGYSIVESDLSDIEKKVFFWKTLIEEIESNSDTLYKVFPEKYHSYNDNNFKKLYDWIKICKEGIPMKDAFKKKFITIEDLQDCKIHPYYKENLENIFSALCQDGWIEYGEENLHILKKWIGSKMYLLYIPKSFGDEEEDERDQMWWSFTAKLSLLEQRLFYWTALFCGEGNMSSLESIKRIPGRYSVYNSKNLRNLFEKITKRLQTPKKVIDGETGIMSALRNGDGDIVGF